MKSIKTTGSGRSTRRAQRERSRSSDNHFETQHEQMLSRQQFRTNTSRIPNRSSTHSNSTHSNSSSRKASSVHVGAGGNPRAVVHVVHGADSYESGYSHMSRRSEQVVPKTIQPHNHNNTNETVQNVKIIIAGM
jgi:hypothetical protein